MKRLERRLGAVVARAGVAEDAALAFEARVAGPDVVDQAALLADLGEEPAAHAAAEDFHAEADGVVVVVRLGDRRVRDADVRLLATPASRDESCRAAA